MGIVAIDPFIRTMVRDESLTRGLGDVEARMLVDWLVDWAELLGNNLRSGPDAVALIARNRPAAVLVVALFFGALRNSTLALAASGTPRDIVDVVQALLVLGAILPPVYLTVRERRLRRQIATARA